MLHGIFINENIDDIAKFVIYAILSIENITNRFIRTAKPHEGATSWGFLRY